MGLLDWFRRRKNPLGIKKSKEEEALERTRNLRNKIQEHMEEPNKSKRKKESV